MNAEMYEGIAPLVGLLINETRKFVEQREEITTDPLPHNPSKEQQPPGFSESVSPTEIAHELVNRVLQEHGIHRAHAPMGTVNGSNDIKGSGLRKRTRMLMVFRDDLRWLRRTVIRL